MPEKVIELERLSKSFNRNKILDSITLSVFKGEIFCLLAKNASGKSTLIKIISGILKSDKGKILIENKAPIYPEVFRTISVLLENPSYYPHLTLSENLEYFLKILGEYEDELPVGALGLNEHMKNRIKQLSRGTIQKIALLLSLWKIAEIYILDEPLVHLDPDSREFIKKRILYLKDNEKTVFLTTHLRETIGICSRIAIMEDGRITFVGDPKDSKVNDFFHGTSY